MPLSEKVRIEIFIPDLPDPVYASILEELGNELTYAYGGCTVVATSGKYRSSEGLILPDKIQLLFSDTPFLWDRDRLMVELYAERIRTVVKRSLSREEAIMVVAYPVFHAN
ncbi:MAG TPA: hypothetical protein VHQ95_14300 [Pyrinomonadaceae bacterium]|nr:hypothetical protein [Pyrinomonadaceae bacterium]